MDVPDRDPHSYRSDSKADLVVEKDRPSSLTGPIKCGPFGGYSM